MTNDTLSQATEVLTNPPKHAEYWTPVQWDSAHPESGAHWTESGDCVRVMRFGKETDNVTDSERLEHIRLALDGLAKTSFR